MRPFDVSGGGGGSSQPANGWHAQQPGPSEDAAADDARRPFGPLGDSSGNANGGGVKAIPLPTFNDADDDDFGHHHHPHARRRSIATAAAAATALASSLARRAARPLARCLPRGVDPRAALRTAFFVLSWYVLSTCLGLFNKILVGQDHKGMFGRGAFPAPLFLSSAQFACQAFLARGALGIGLAKRTPGAGRLNRHDYLRLALPNGITTGIDIGFSNKSLAYITMSFYTMCKSTTPVWLLLFAFAWGLEKPSWALGGVVAVIVAGLLMLVHGEVGFHLLGFVLVMSAACLSGLRFTLTQVLLQGRKSGGGGAGASSSAGGAAADGGGNNSQQPVRLGRAVSNESSGGSGGGGGGGDAGGDASARPAAGAAAGAASAPAAAPPGHQHHKPPAFGGPLEVVALLTPIMAVTTLLLSLAWERPWHSLPGSPYFTSAGRAAATAGLVLFSAVLAFLMVWAEYQVIRETSALTFMVCGIVKELLTVVVAVSALGDPFTPANGAGLAVTIFGVGLFNAYKFRKLSLEAAAAGQEAGVPATTSVVASEGAVLLPDVKAVRVASDELAPSPSSSGEGGNGGLGGGAPWGGGRRWGGAERATGAVPGTAQRTASGGGAIFDLESPHDELGADRSAAAAAAGGGGPQQQLHRRPSSGNGTPSSSSLAGGRGQGAFAPALAAAPTHHHHAPPPVLRAASTAGAVMGAELGGLEGLVATAAEVDAAAEAAEAAAARGQQQQQQELR